MFGIGMIPATVLFAITLCLPESPRWLASRGEIASARVVLAGPVDPQDVQATLQNIQNGLPGESGTWRDLLTHLI